MLRTFGFVIGLGLASVGLLFLLDVSLALQVRETAVTQARQLVDPLLGREWQHEEPLPVEEAALPPPMRASDAERAAPPRDVPPAEANGQTVAAVTSPATRPEPDPGSEPGPDPEPSPNAKPDPNPGPRADPELDRLLEALSSYGNEETMSDEAPEAPDPHAARASADSGADSGARPSRSERASSVPDKTATSSRDPASGGDSPSASAPQWHRFWSPFRSERAANGFATRLANLTGLEFTVLAPIAGEYHVAFAYRDEVEKRAAVEAIERQAGLSLSGSPVR